MTLAGLLSLVNMQPAIAGGNLTLPFAIPDPRITSWTDHHYPNRQSDGIMVRFDGATGYAYDGHRGTDFAVPSNTPVVAADDGTVIYSEWSNDGGWGVVIDHATDRTAYFHNNQLFVYPGQHVSRGQLIALSGSTGNSTGPHVHFEVRDLQTPWHSIDPYGWTGKGPDPWSYDMGYLWTSNPPVPFLLPLAFFSGAHWNYWYGIDGPPPPVTWHLRDGGHGLAGFAAAWDRDPGVQANRTLGLTGSSPVPGPGSHTLHLRVFDRAGASADITYLYLYDVDPPSSTLRVDGGQKEAAAFHWSGTDALSGVKEVSLEVAQGDAAFRPWFSQSLDQSSEGTQQGAARFLGEPGATYRVRLQLRDAARNPAPPVTTTMTTAAKPAYLPTAADSAILGPLPDNPDGTAPSGGLRQEHPLTTGASVLEGNAVIEGLGATRMVPVTPPPSMAAAVDVATTSTGSLLLLADGTTWRTDGTPGPRYATTKPVRLLAALDGTAIAMDADGAMAMAGGATPEQLWSLPSGTAVVDAGLFAGTHGGLALDSNGSFHAFGGADAALASLPASWSLPDRPAAIAVAGSADAPAGLITDASGDWQTFGSLLLLTNQLFGGQAFDPMTGLPVR